MRTLSPLRRVAAAAVSASAILVGAFSAPLAARAQPDARAIVTPAHVRFVLSALAHDSMEGRGTGTRGSLRAARFIAEQFRQAGLTPAGDSGYFQHVPLYARMLDPNSTIGVEGTTLRALTDFVLASIPRTDPRPLDGVEVIYGGVQGDTAKPLTAEQVRGKLVVMSPAPPALGARGGGPGGSGGPGGRGGRGGPPVSCRDTAVAGAAPAAGGAGAAGGRAGGGGGGGGRGGGRAGGRGAGPAAALSEAAGIATISGDQLPVTAVGNAKRPASAFVKNPAAPPAAPPSGPTALTITARAAEVLLGAPIASATKGIGGRTVRSTIRLIEQPAPGGNVVGIIEGSDSELRSEVVLVDAHYDHLGVRTPVPPATDSIFNGADDDASGTTAVIEIARAIKAGPAPRRTLVFLATTGEEVGLLGTNWFIANPARPLSQMVANLEIEMINRPDSLAGGPGKAWLTGYERSTMGDFFAAAGLPIGPDKRPEQNFFMRSDNIAFARMGVPAHTLSSFDLHDDYHRANDEVGLANFEHMAAVINAGVSAVRILADGKKPEWYPGCKP